MFAKWRVMNRLLRSRNYTRWMLASAVSLLISGVTPVLAQAQRQAPPQDNTQNSTQTDGKPKQEVPADAGGPTGNVGPYSIPKKNPEEAPPPPPPAPPPNKVEGMPHYSIKVNVPLVNVDVLVTTKTGQFIPGLKKENFRLFEDGSQQQITNFNVSKAPITAVLLVEFASTNYRFMIDALQAS